VARALGNQETSRRITEHTQVRNLTHASTAIRVSTNNHIGRDINEFTQERSLMYASTVKSVLMI